MSKKDKLLKRFLSNPKDFTWDELVSLIEGFGYVADNKGKTSGSAVKFDKLNHRPILLHKPHPSKILKSYAIKQVKQQLMQEGYI